MQNISDPLPSDEGRYPISLKSPIKTLKKGVSAPGGVGSVKVQKDLHPQKEENTQKHLPEDELISTDDDSILDDLEEFSDDELNKKTPTKILEQNSAPKKRVTTHPTKKR